MDGQSHYSALLDFDPPSDRIRRALGYAREHLHEPLPVARLAEQANLSERQSGSAFRAVTGVTPARAPAIPHSPAGLGTATASRRGRLTLFAKPIRHLLDRSAAGRSRAAHQEYGDEASSRRRRRGGIPRMAQSPMSVRGKNILVTGGSRGLGLGLVEALVGHGALVTVVAREETALADVQTRLGVGVITADVAREGVAQRILIDLRPDVVVLNAGVTPVMAPIGQLSWSDFSLAWETDVKAGLYWIQAALALPLPRGARVLVTSSGAAIDGSPLSGGYAGAKRMLWLMAKYANRMAQQKKLDLRFQVIVPRQIVGGTGVGDEASTAYARAAGLEPKAFLARSFPSLPPREFGEHVTTILSDQAYADALAFSIRGDTGVMVLEEAAA